MGISPPTGIEIAANIFKISVKVGPKVFQIEKWLTYTGIQATSDRFAFPSGLNSATQSVCHCEYPSTATHDIMGIQR